MIKIYCKKKCRLIKFNKKGRNLLETKSTNRKLLDKANEEINIFSEPLVEKE